MISIANFRKTIRDYYRENSRPMPWRRTRDPYRILVSEIMLQQTQVARVTGFYEKFVKQFPDFTKLARAKTADVLRAWQGLGYNRRALALQKLARKVVEGYGGRLPRDKASLLLLPGVGEYTAGAVRAFAFNEPEIFVETNIRRVFIHFFFPRRKSVTDAAIRRYIERTLDRKNPRGWYWALMDYGAALGGEFRGGKKNVKAGENPNRRSAHYTKQSKFAGSDRELRGKILRKLLQRRKIAGDALPQEFGEPPQRISKILESLRAEGFIRRIGKDIVLM